MIAQAAQTFRTISLDLSVIIVSWNVRKLLVELLHSLTSATSGLESEIIVVDNASTDGSADLVATQFPDVRLLRNSKNLGFSKANNQGILISQGRYIVLLNSDTVIPEHAFPYLVTFMDNHANAGAVSPRLVQPDGMPQPYAFGNDPTPVYLLKRMINRLLFKRYLHDWGTDRVQQTDWVSGACLLVRREAIQRAGLLDESFFMYFEDNDWCLRIRKAGWKIYYNPAVEIIHIGGQSLAQNPSAQRTYYQSLRYFYRKHYSRMAAWLLHIMLAPYVTWLNWQDQP